MSYTPEQAQANREDDDVNRTRYMLGHPLGRAYVWKALEECGVFGASFAGERPLTTAFHEGRRDIGIRLLAEVMAFDANALTLMQAEDTERKMRYHVRAQERDDEL